MGFDEHVWLNNKLPPKLRGHNDVEIVKVVGQLVKFQCIYIVVS